jgi:urease subunit alpha
MFGGYGAALHACSAHFVSEAGIASGNLTALARPLVGVRGCRALGKKDMVWNAAVPKIDVDPDSYEVRADGELLRCEPADVLPLAQRYFLF